MATSAVVPRSVLFAFSLASTSVARRHAVPGGAALLEASEEFPVSRALAPLLAATARETPAAPGALSRPAFATPRALESDAEVARVAPKTAPPAPLATLEANSPLLAEVASRGSRGALVVPTEWEGKLERGSVVALRGPDEGSSSHYMATAKLLASPEFRVRISAGRSDAPETIRELLASQLLSQTGCVPTFFERQVFADATFMMTEYVGGRTLEALVKERSARANKHPAVPLQQALPLMMDLLRGIQSMEHLSIVHGDLSEANVYLVDGDRRAVITNFHHACLQDTADERLDCAVKEGSLPKGSELRQAPETRETSGGTAGNVWQLGLVFARMMFGGDVPTEATVLEKMSTADMAKLAASVMKDGSSGEVRERVREVIQRHFSISQAEGFERLQGEYEDVLNILVGMLAKDPDDRWTASQALQALEALCAARDVPVPGPRPQAELPEGLVEDWQ